MNRISEYLGSGHRSSAISFSSSSADSRTAAIAGIVTSRMYSPCLSTSSCGWFSARLADSSDLIASINFESTVSTSLASSGSCALTSSAM